MDWKGFHSLGLMRDLFICSLSPVSMGTIEIDAWPSSTGREKGNFQRYFLAIFIYSLKYLIRLLSLYELTLHLSNTWTVCSVLIPYLMYTLKSDLFIYINKACIIKRELQCRKERYFRAIEPYKHLPSFLQTVDVASLYNMQLLIFTDSFRNQKCKLPCF